MKTLWTIGRYVALGAAYIGLLWASVSVGMWFDSLSAVALLSFIGSLFFARLVPDSRFNDLADDPDPKRQLMKTLSMYICFGAMWLVLAWFNDFQSEIRPYQAALGASWLALAVNLAMSKRHMLKRFEQR